MKRKSSVVVLLDHHGHVAVVGPYTAYVLFGGRRPATTIIRKVRSHINAMMASYNGIKRVVVVANKNMVKITFQPVAYGAMETRFRTTIAQGFMKFLCKIEA